MMLSSIELSDFKNYLTQDNQELFDRIINRVSPNLNSVWIAGGLFKRLILDMGFDKGDIDIFFNNEESLLRTKTMLLSNSDTKELVSTDNAINLEWTIDGCKLKLSLIKLFHPSIEVLLNSFDFTLCQIGYNGEKIILNPMGLYDLGRNDWLFTKLLIQ